MSKDLSIISKRLSVWSPDELHLLVAHSFLLVFVVSSSEEPRVIAHIRKESGIGVRVAKWINLPSNSGSYSELIEDPLVTHDMVVDHIFISRTSLIMHRPTGIHKLKLTTLDQALHLFLLFVGLEIPPHAEEFHLDFREFALWVVCESVDNVSQLHLDIGELDVFAGTVEVLINGLQPSNIVMGMRNYVNGYRATRLIIFGAFTRLSKWRHLK